MPYVLLGILVFFRLKQIFKFLKKNYSIPRTLHTFPLFCDFVYFFVCYWSSENICKILNNIYKYRILLIFSLRE